MVPPSEAPHRTIFFPNGHRPATSPEAGGIHREILPCPSLQIRSSFAAMSQRRGCLPSPLVAILPVALVALFLWTTPASGAHKVGATSKKSQENAARKACLSGDYAKGVDLLSDLFVSTKDPTYLFNQGRCFEQNRRYEDAISRFHEFLKAGGGDRDPADKAAAETHIADCKEMLAQERGIAPAPVAAPMPQALPATAPTREASATMEPALPLVAEPAREQAPVASGRGARIGGILVASFGVAAAGTGLLFNLKANSLVTDMESTTDGYTKESDRKTWQTLSVVGYGVGAACIVTGAILYGVGLHRNSSSSATVAILPTVDGGRAGVALAGAF